MAEFDPSRAKPETVREPCAALDDYERRVDDIDTLEPEGKRLSAALDGWRSECRIPLRTRAEVDAEIAQECRDYYERVTRGDGSSYRADNKPPQWDALTSGEVERLNRLCREPTSDSGPSSVDAADGDGPLPPSAPVSPAGADLSPPPAYFRLLHQYLEHMESHVRHQKAVLGNSNIIHDVMRWTVQLPPLPDSGPPGAAAAKESSDTTAAAPEGAAMKGESHACNPGDRDCNCDQAVELGKRIGRARDVIRKWNFFGNASARQFADEIGAALAGEPWP